MTFDLIVVCVAAFFAGFVDSIVGGGGLISLPALFTTYPNVAPALLLGSNKINSVFGTGYAAWQMTRKVKLVWLNLIPGIITAAIGSFLGAWLATVVSAELLRKLMPLVLLLVLIYTIVKKDIGTVHQPTASALNETGIIALIGLVIGVYDGFFGPGTGTFFIFLLVRFVHYDFLHAATAAKLLNIATNFAAIVLFGWSGYIWWQVALLMAAANILGSFFGTRLALQRGVGFIRLVFIVVVSLLIIKTGYDSFFSL